VEKIENDHMKRILDLNKLEDPISPGIYNIVSDESSPRLKDQAFSPPKQSIMDNASGLNQEQLKPNPYIDLVNDKTPEIIPPGSNFSLMMNKVMSFGNTRNQAE